MPKLVKSYFIKIVSKWFMNVPKRKLMPPKPSTSLLVSNSSKSAEGSPESKQTDAAKLSNCSPTFLVAAIRISKIDIYWKYWNLDQSSMVFSEID